MSYIIRGLSPEPFTHLFNQTSEILAAYGAVRKTADAAPGYPCRISLEDAALGEQVILLNHESHTARTPYRSAYAIYIRENQTEAAVYEDALPPVFLNRPIALRMFNAGGMLVGATIAQGDALEAAILQALARDDVDYIHAHNAAHGCFAAEIRRS